MQTEEKILAILETMQGDIKELKAEQAEMKVDLSAVKHDLTQMKATQSQMQYTLNAVFNHAAVLTEWQTSTDTVFRDVEAALKKHAHSVTKIRAAR